MSRSLLLSCEAVSKAYGARTIFAGLSFGLLDGDQVGLVGPNGSGKSTLLRILAGAEPPDRGTRAVRGGVRVGYVPQDPAFPPGATVEEVVSAGLGAVDEDHRPGRLAQTLGRAGFADGDVVVDTLSGGWKKRLAIARELAAAPDVLLLDEPTNNLDINTIRWLEGVLNARNSTMVIISHDRHFLNSVCTHMADLDYGELRVYPGNYDEYMTAATQVREQLLSGNAKKKAQIAELQTFVSRFSANASKAKQATSRARQIEKIKLDDVKLSSRVSPFIRFDQDKKLYRQALEAEGLSKGYGEKPLFRNLNLMVEVGERVAVIGPNGIGKSTLLRTLVGDLKPDSGRVKMSENVNIGYFAQDHAADFSDNTNLFDWMSLWAKPEDNEQSIRAVLGRMLFSREESSKSVKIISGGEQGRMLFGKLMLQRPNVLVMDEPTNHLDMESIEALNLALENYPGTLIFVSHDREFVSSLATRIIELTPQGVVNFGGSYDDYLRSQGVELANRATA
jgi:ATPase subunit of ABC transporter with duplicated ATPase domains